MKASGGGVYVCLASGLLFALVGLNDSRAAEANPCRGLPTAAELKAVLMQVVPGGFEANGGVGAPEWLTLVDNSGMVCAVHSVGGLLQGTDLGTPTRDLTVGNPDSTQFHATFLIEFLDTEGKFLFSIPGTATATRIQVEQP